MDVVKDQYASSKLLALSLERKGYTSILDPATRIIEFTSPLGYTWKTRAAHIAYPFNSDEARRSSINKHLGYEIAQKNDFSTPFTRYLGEEALLDEEARELLHRYKRLIVKPDNLSLSKGLTVNIQTVDALKAAIAYARDFSPSVLVQEQVKGDEIRFTVLNGKVKAALLRQTARVMGDGQSTIAQLIQHENESRKKLVFEYIAYPQLDGSIIDPALLTDQSIPSRGTVVQLSHSTMIRGGCSVYNILDQIHPSYVKRVEKLVANLDAGFIVVDVFCADYTQPAAPRNYWLIEFNTAPVLKLFYGCRDGNHFDITPLLAEMIDEHLQSTAH